MNHFTARVHQHFHVNYGWDSNSDRDMQWIIYYFCSTTMLIVLFSEGDHCCQGFVVPLLLSLSSGVRLAMVTVTFSLSFVQISLNAVLPSHLGVPRLLSPSLFQHLLSVPIYPPFFRSLRMVSRWQNAMSISYLVFYVCALSMSLQLKHAMTLLGVL